MKKLEKTLRNCNNRNLCDVLELGGRAALAGGAVLEKLYGKNHHIKKKGKIDLVTEADIAAEKAVIATLREQDKDSAIIAEESAGNLESLANTKGSWIVDPLDGTTNYAHHLPWFTVSIGFVKDNESLAGIIYAPISGELFCAVKGVGAWLNGDKIQVSSTSSLAAGLLVTGFPYYIQEHPDAVMQALKTMVTKCQGVRRSGSASLDMAYVACGRFDAFWELNLKPWDIAAGYCLISEAGGVVTDFAGRPSTPFIAETLASNTTIHRAAVKLLSKFSTRT